jgi:5-phospho-D-xylono-1,4-lactonase
MHALARERRACVVEMTTVDYGRDVAALVALSQRTGVSIVSATGYNTGRYCRPYFEGRQPDEIAAIAITDITDGVDATGARCGVVKFGTSLNGIEPWEEVAARAAARTHRATGAPILTHTEAGTMAEEQLALLQHEGISPSAVTIGHLDRNPNLELHRRLARAGAFLSYDQVPKPKYATETPAMELIIALAHDGLHKQIVVGGDFARRSLFTGYGGSPGLTYLPTLFANRLRQGADNAGLDGTNIVHDILRHNPQRALSFRPTQ